MSRRLARPSVETKEDENEQIGRRPLIRRISHIGPDKRSESEGQKTLILRDPGRRSRYPGSRGTGYKGRAGIFEGIIMDEAVEEAVLRDPREHIIIEAARPQKIPSMLEDGVEKVLLGITSISELERVVELPQPGDVLKPKATTLNDSDDDFNLHIV